MKKISKLVNYKIVVLFLILSLGFIVRLYKIQNPIADWHSWRQADTSAVSRNFVKHGINILYPTYDEMSDVSAKGFYNKETYRFVEFPIFNLLHILVYFSSFNQLSFEISGRLVSVFASLFSSVFIYKIVSKKIGNTVGLISTFFYLFLPFNIFFTRVILPDPLMVTFFLASIYFAYSNKYLYSVIFGILAVLTKPIAIFFIFPAFVHYLRQDIKKAIFYIFSAVTPFLAWRWWSLMHPQGVPSSNWLLNGDGIRFRPAFFQWIFGVRIGELILGKWGTWQMLTGVINSNGFFSWIIAAIVYLFTFAKGNVQHDYYQLPIIPIIAILLAIGTNQLWKSEANILRTILVRSVLVFATLMTFALSWYEIRGLYQINNGSIIKAGQKADQILPKDAIVVAPYGGDTAFLYQTNRKGFASLPLPIKDLIDRFGAEYYISVNYDDVTNQIIKKYTLIETNPEFVIVKLVEPIRPL